MRPQVGELINNKYRLVRQIGDGGMGSVFEAKHEVLGNSVALKFLHSELARRGGLVQRFLQEARVSAKIQSPHVVRVTDVEQTPQGLPFIVMEYLQGKSLQALYEDLYKAGKRLGYDDALEYAIQMLDGLEAAHEEGIVHRDLKPDNVMIVTGKRGDAIVKLLDFGIAKLRINGELYKGLTRPGVIMGTPEYMAPEQVFSADAVDGRADIFSCGVMIFEMLAGRRPVGGDEAHQIAAAYLSGSIAKLSELAPQIAPELASAVHKAMAADPKDRFATVAEFRAVVEPFANKRSRGHSTPPPVSPSAHREPLSSVPKTIPPVDGAAAAPAASPAGMSSLDGVSVASNPGVIEGGSTEKVAEPWRGDDVASISAKLSAATGNKGKDAFDSTVEGAPFFPGSTEAYQEPFDAGAVRPGGTDVGAAGAALPGTVSAGTVGGYAPSPAIPVPSYASAPPRAAAKKKSGMGVFGILAIGAGVSFALMGGLYAYDRLAHGGSSGDDRDSTMALPTTKKATEPQPQPTQEQPQPQPQPTFQQPVPQPTVAQPQPTNTSTRPPSTGTTKPTSTATTPPPWMLPSAPPFEIPTTLPGWPPNVTLPGQQPAQPSNTGGGGRPKLEPIKPSGDNGTTSPSPTTPPATTTNTSGNTGGLTRPTFRLPRPSGSSASTTKPASSAPTTTASTGKPPAGHTGSRPRPIKIRPL
ncbi:MAG TPA: serine/threonine-protein kinase [Polyangiaceae bacterium]|jgi:serine/threonine-protein kinase|nr:serine/threonine-protein kinase [Polyangiaceae bacterium]